LDRLNVGKERKLILISAMAGTGKTTLLNQWLQECPYPSAWLSLDEHDNDLVVFLSYLIGAIGSIFPGACEKTLDLLSAAQTPLVRVLSTSLIIELDELCKTYTSETTAVHFDQSSNCFILALDDYHMITEPTIHELVSSLIAHLPHGVHLALVTRADPPLPLAALRARREMIEVRFASLRFTSEEVRSFLEATSGRNLSPETIQLLEDRTEGWIVGLRLAALTMRTRVGEIGFVQAFKGTDGDLVVEYLVNEVLAQQSPEIQDFTLRTSVLDRVCAPLCEVLTGISAIRSQEILDWIAGANLFLIPLDEEGKWYRYHHLFRDLLRHMLQQQTRPTEISELHTHAGTWFAENDLIDEALHHYSAAENIAEAVALVARHRYILMNRAQWSRLKRYLQKFRQEILDQYPDLLMLKAWLLYHCGQYVELPTALQRLEESIALASLPPNNIRHLEGEISALRSLLHYHAFDPDNALVFAQQALEKTPRKLWIVRILARLFLAGVLHMRGESNQAYSAIYRGFEEEETRSDAFKASLLMTTCHIHWLDADLNGMARAARKCITLSHKANASQFFNYGQYHLGKVYYQQNDLIAAEKCFSTVVQQPYLNYGECFAHSACALALIHQINNRPQDADSVIEFATSFMLETGNTTLLPLLRSFEAEIALQQGQVAKASQWAALLDPPPPFRPVYGFFWPHLTLVKTWLAQDTDSSLKAAAVMLTAAKAFVEITHNTRFLMDVLALQALLNERQGQQQSALELLERAIVLAEPSGFIRLFVGLGPPLDLLLERLRWQDGTKGTVAVDYVTQILSAFKMKAGGQTTDAMASTALDELLTPREREVLTLLRQLKTNTEIASQLVISPSTVKTHTLNIYRKLDVNGRKQAVARAQELDIV
jgi:LuxR family maltose regulon positive regulatory protein